VQAALHGRRAAGRAGGAAALREPALDAARVEAVAAGRHDAHGVPVRELGEADGALRRGARQLRPGGGVHQQGGRRRLQLHLHRGLLSRVVRRQHAAAVALATTRAGAAAAAEQVAHGGVERQAERERGQQGGQDDGHVAGEVAGAGVGPPAVGGDAGGGLRPPVLLLLVVGLPLRRHGHGVDSRLSCLASGWRWRSC
jgi:hypothetical protein